MENGSGPHGGLDVAAISASLQELIATEQERLVPLEEQVIESRERIKRLQRSLDALTGTARPLPARTPGRRPAPSQRGYVWKVSEKKIEQVWAAVLDLTAGDPDVRFRASTLAEHAGVSNEAVRRSLQHLRERERVRVAGHPGGRIIEYAVMPGAAERTDDGT